MPGSAASSRGRNFRLIQKFLNAARSPNQAKGRGTCGHARDASSARSMRTASFSVMPVSRRGRLDDLVGELLHLAEVAQVGRLEAGRLHAMSPSWVGRRIVDPGRFRCLTLRATRRHFDAPWPPAIRQVWVRSGVLAGAGPCSPNSAWMPTRWRPSSAARPGAHLPDPGAGAVGGALLRGGGRAQRLKDFGIRLASGRTCRCWGRCG